MNATNSDLAQTIAICTGTNSGSQMGKSRFLIVLFDIDECRSHHPESRLRHPAKAFESDRDGLTNGQRPNQSGIGSPDRPHRPSGNSCPCPSRNYPCLAQSRRTPTDSSITRQLRKGDKLGTPFPPIPTRCVMIRIRRDSEQTVLLPGHHFTEQTARYYPSMACISGDNLTPLMQAIDEDEKMTAIDAEQLDDLVNRLKQRALSNNRSLRTKCFIFLKTLPAKTSRRNGPYS